MQMFFFLFALFVAASAYGNGGTQSGGYGGIARGLNSNDGAGQVVEAAIQSRHNVKFRDVPSTGAAAPTTIEVGANSLPVTLLFKSASSSLNVQQVHDGAQGSVQESSSDDEAHVLKHSVNKPIIQEIREVITPFRKITQEIQPVQEEINTIVARNSGNSGAALSGASGFSGAGIGRSSGHSGASRSVSGYGSSASRSVSGRAY